MPIDPTHNSIQRLATTELREVKKTEAASPTVKSTPSATAELRTSSAPDTSRDVDIARVNEIRQAISEGRLEIKSENIADGLIASTRELLSNNP